MSGPPTETTRPDRARSRGHRSRPRVDRREVLAQLRRPSTNYDYAGQDPVNGYDLSGTMEYDSGDQSSWNGTAYGSPTCLDYQCQYDKSGAGRGPHSNKNLGFGDLKRGALRFGRGAARKPQDLAVAITATATGAVILYVAGRADAVCRRETAGTILTLACVYTTTKAVAAGATMLIVAGSEYRIVWNAGKKP